MSQLERMSEAVRAWCEAHEDDECSNTLHNLSVGLPRSDTGCGPECG